MTYIYSGIHHYGCETCGSEGPTGQTQEEALSFANGSMLIEPPKLKWRDEDETGADSVPVFGIRYGIYTRLGAKATRYPCPLALGTFNTIDEAKEACQADFNTWFKRQMEVLE